MKINKLRNLGSIYTPPDFANLLTSWSIQHKDEKVLDMGVGDGVFVFSAYNRLVQLGAVPAVAQQQIYGTEVHTPSYAKFIHLASKSNLIFSNINCENFFNANFPLVDVLIGNPPYVRRSQIEDIDEIRYSVFKNGNLISEKDFSRLSDLYIYFLLKASSFLKPGGRLAVITADTWLNAKYGKAFKEFLNKNFEINSLISLDRQVFGTIEVKPVLIFATKKTFFHTASQVNFIRVKNGLPVCELLDVLNTSTSKKKDIIINKISTHILDSTSSWGARFKSPEVCDKISSHKLMSPICSIAKTSIGCQTLAKEFFVLTKEKIEHFQIEREFIIPLLQSPKQCHHPVIDIGTPPDFYLFYCSKSKEELIGTNALKYIEKAETERVKVRGKDLTVIGYHNKERIKQAFRPFWYDLRSYVEKNGCADILFPRLMYKNFQIIWNKAFFVPGELFIQFVPFMQPKMDTEIYLAILSSSITEMMLRASSQLYGGGAYNISPGRIGNVPILNVSLLSQQQIILLNQAYQNYLRDKDRSVIDNVLYDILNFKQSVRRKIAETLDDLTMLATSLKPSKPNFDLATSN
ncbi:MAG: N-6 DNA methylase [Blastocatellia bacterium]